MKRKPRVARRVAVLVLLLAVPTAVGAVARPPPSEIRRLILDGRYAAAERAAWEVLESSQRDSGEESLATAAALDLVAEAMWRNGSFLQPEALESAEQALLLRRRLMPPGDPAIARSLAQIAEVLRERGRYPEAEWHFREALRIYEGALRAEPREVAAALYGLGDVVRRQGRLLEAEEHHRRCLAIYTSLFGSASRWAGKALNGLANVLADQAKTESTSFYEQSVAVLERALGPSHPDLAVSLHNLANMRWWGGQYEAADALFERAERIQEASLGREHPWLGYTLAYHALALVDLGELQRAREMYERALAIFEDKLGTDHPEVAETLLSQGRLLATLGEYRAGRRAVERSLELYQRSLGPRHASVATALMQLSELATGIGDVRRAEAHYRQAIAIWEQGYAGRTQTQWAEAVVERADQLLIMRRYAEAGKLYDQAIRAYKETDEPDDPWVGRQLLMLAETKRLAGEPAAAEPLYRRALAIRERASGPVHPEVARILLGLAAAQSGGVAGALELSRRAVAILEAAFGTRHPETGRALAALASHEARSGDLEVAFEQALRAEEIARSHLRLTARSLAEREALTYAAVRVSSLDLLLSLALRSPDPKKKERAFDALIRSRALVLDEMGERHRRLVGSEEPGGVRLATELRAASTRLAFLSLRGPGREALGSYRNRLQRAEEEKERLERQLAEMSFAFRRERDTGRAGLREVAAALPPRSALLSIARFASSELAGSAGVGASSEPAPFYLAFVLLSGRQSVEIAPLGPAAEVGGHVERLQSHMARVGGMGIAEEKAAERAYRALGAELRRVLWDPIEPLLNGAETVFVVPDGALNLVHLAILPVAEERFLLEQGRLLHYLAAERDLVQAEWPETGGGLLALGDPDFDEQGLFAAGTGPPADSLARAATPEAGSAGVFRGRRSACGDFLTMIFDRLPATGREVDEVALVWHRTGGDLTADGTSSDRRARILRGAAASEAAFKADAPGWEVLHLATHGFFLGRRCPSPSTSEAEGSLAAPAENPFLRSGLALAGANHREAALEGEEDGILTAEEIAALDLTGTRWAVLSACDSGLGEIRAGEGVLGLRRAFQIAGARSVIMSLWPVDDEASQSWMKTLYRHRFVEGRSTAEAVHHASLELLRARREAGLGTHPFHWAGFVAAGDWR